MRTTLLILVLGLVSLAVGCSSFPPPVTLSPDSFKKCCVTTDPVSGEPVVTIKFLVVGSMTAEEEEVEGEERVVWLAEAGREGELVFVLTAEEEEVEEEVAATLTTRRRAIHPLKTDPQSREYLAEITDGPATMIGNLYAFHTKAGALSTVELIVDDTGYPATEGESEALSDWLDDHWISPDDFYEETGF